MRRSIILALLLLAGCGGKATTNQGSPAATSSVPSPITTTSSPTPNSRAALDQFCQDIKSVVPTLEDFTNGAVTTGDLADRMYESQRAIEADLAALEEAGETQISETARMLATHLGQARVALLGSDIPGANDAFVKATKDVNAMVDQGLTC